MALIILIPGKEYRRTEQQLARLPIKMILIAGILAMKMMEITEMKTARGKNTAKISVDIYQWLIISYLTLSLE